MDSKLNETTETDFNSTLPDVGTLFASHTINTLSVIDLDKNNYKKNNNNNNNNNKEVINDTFHNTNNYENHRNRKPVNSTELTQNFDAINTTLPLLSNINLRLLLLQRRNSVHFKTEPVILNTSAQSSSTNNQNMQLTPQQLVNFVRQLNS